MALSNIYLGTCRYQWSPGISAGLPEFVFRKQAKTNTAIKAVLKGAQTWAIVTMAVAVPMYIFGIFELNNRGVVA